MEHLEYFLYIYCIFINYSFIYGTHTSCIHKYENNVSLTLCCIKEIWNKNGEQKEKITYKKPNYSEHNQTNVMLYNFYKFFDKYGQKKRKQLVLNWQ